MYIGVLAARNQVAHEKILKAAAELAASLNLDNPALLAGLTVQEKDKQVKAMKEREAVAALLEALAKRAAEPLPKSGLEDLEDLLAIQTQPGNYDANAYMFGMANGLILADATLRGVEPQYLDAPETWLDDQPPGTEPIFQVTVEATEPDGPVKAFPDPVKMTVDQVRAIAQALEDPEVLHWMRETEQAGKARKGVLEALEARLAELSETAAE